VGGGAPVRSESEGHRFGAKRSTGKMFLGVPLHFLVLKVHLVVLVSAFVMVSTVWSVSCLLFFCSRCPPCPAICKSGGARASVPHGVGATVSIEVDLWCVARELTPFDL